MTTENNESVSLKFSEGIAVFKKDGKYGYLGKDRNELIEPKFENITIFKNGVGFVKTDGLWGVVDKNMDYKVVPTYDTLKQSSYGSFIVSKNKDKGVLSRVGKLVINCHYEDILYGGELMYGASYKGVWGYLDVYGNVAIPFKYEQVCAFSHGVATVKLDGKWGLIDSEGIAHGKFDKRDPTDTSMTPKNVYIGTKIVTAIPKKGISFGEVTDGFRIKYPDGYESWTPYDVFVKNYRSLSDGEIELVG